MDVYDRIAMAEDARFDDFMEQQHRAGLHDDEPDPDCWVCDPEHYAS